MMGEARSAFSLGKYKEAISLIQKAVEVSPRSPVPYELLALVHQQLGDGDSELNALLISAHLKRDGQAWKALASLAVQRQRYRDTVYCVNKAIQHRVADEDLLWDRSVAYAHLGRLEMARKGFKVLVKRTKLADAYTALSKTLYLQKRHAAACDVLYDFLREGKKDGVECHTVAELADRFVQARVELGQHSRAIKEYWYVKSLFPGLSKLSSDFSPLFLANLYICCIKSPAHSFKGFDTHFASLKRQLAAIFERVVIPSVETFELIRRVAFAFYDVKKYSGALKWCQKIENIKDLPIITLKIADCHREMENYELAVPLYEKILIVRKTLDFSSHF